MIAINWGEMALGDKGIVAGFQKSHKTYQSKKGLSMGLTPGMVFSITHYAPNGCSCRNSCPRFCAN